MANKRQLKKYINNNCRELAFVTFIADCAAPDTDDNKYMALLEEIDQLRCQALDAVNFSFDKTPSAFENKKAYNTAKTAYYKKAYAKFIDEYQTRMQKVIDEINALQPKAAGK